MTNNKVYLCLMCLLVLAIPARASTLLHSDDFEEGASWTYDTHWDQLTEYMSDEWTIVNTAPHGGSWCAQSKEPGSGSLEDSIFQRSINAESTPDQIFIRWWFKAGPSLNNYQAEFMRMTNDPGVDECEIGQGTSCGESMNTHPYNVNYNTMTYGSGWGKMTAETDWTELAILFDYKNDRIVHWKNQSTYTDGTAAGIIEGDPLLFDGIYTRMMVGIYFKGWETSCDGTGYTFYMDDIEVWDGLPDAEAPTTPTCQGISVQ